MTDREALQRLMQILGPAVPDVRENPDPHDALRGLATEVALALEVLRSVGIEYQRRR